MAYVLASFDGLSLPTYLDESNGYQDLVNGAVVAPLVALPGGRVFDPQGSTIAGRGAEVLKAQTIIVGTSTSSLRSQLDPWQAKIGKRGTLIRQADDGSQQSVTARLIEIDSQRKVENVTFLEIVYTFQILTLPWSGTSQSATEISTTATTDMMTLGVAASPVLSFPLVNGGNVNQPAVTITIEAIGGNITALTLLNQTTGQTFSYSGTVVSGQSLVIDTGALSVQNNGADDYAHFTPPTTFDDWLELVPGTNQIQLTYTTTGTPTSIFAYSDAWA